MSNLVQKVNFQLPGSPEIEMYMYGEATLEANQEMQPVLEKLYKYEREYDLEEKVGDNGALDDLQLIWDELDLGYEHMERAIENLARIANLPINLKRMVEQYDLSEISALKQEIEALMGTIK